MPPRKFSRYIYTEGLFDSDDNFHVSDRVPYKFRELPNNRRHVVGRGDTLFTLASKYFSGYKRAAGLWWIIADFQPSVIHDPTLALEEGSLLIIPSLRTVEEEIFNSDRLDESEI